MATRTPLVDRRMVELAVGAIPGNISEEVIKNHLRNAAPLHKVLDAVFRADLARVDLKALLELLQGQMPRRFAPGVLDAVKALGGQFAQARMTEVPGGETLESQQRDKVIKFWTAWHFKKFGKGERLKIAPSIASQVVYLPDLVEGSLNCSFDKVEKERKSVDEILASLPKVEGLTWIVGNAPTINRVLANHLKETDEYLLPRVCTQTTDTYESPEDGLRRLVVGGFDEHGVYVYCWGPGDWVGHLGFFILGVPQT